MKNRYFFHQPLRSTCVKEKLKRCFILSYCYGNFGLWLLTSLELVGINKWKSAITILLFSLDHL